MVALLCIPSLSAATRADDRDPRSRAEEDVKKEVAKLREKAGRDADETNAAVLHSEVAAPPADRDLSVSLEAVRPPDRDRVLGILAEALANLDRAGETAHGEAEARIKDLSGVWVDTRKSLYEVQSRLQRARIECDTAARTWEGPWFWLAFWAIVAGAVFLLAVTLVGRRWFRRTLRGGEFTAIGILVVMMLVVTVWLWVLKAGGSKTDPKPAEAEGAPAKAHSPTAEESAGGAQGFLADTLWVEKIIERPPENHPILQKWEAARERLRDHYVAGRVAQELAQRILSDRAEFESLKRELEQVEAERDQIAEEVRRKARARQLWVFFVVLGAWGILGVVCYRRRQRNKQTCAKCQQENTLERRRLPTELAGRRSQATYVCTAKWDGKQQCGFRIPGKYLPTNRLCFPLLGDPTTGKTVWLAMLYWKLLMQREDVPEDVLFNCVETRTSRAIVGAEDRGIRAADQADGILGQGIIRFLLQGNRNVDRTLKSEFKDPLVLRFTDRDWLYRGEVLANLFDYSGENFRDASLDNPLRVRMLKNDGAIIVLDVTHPSPLLQFSSLQTFLGHAQDFHGGAGDARIRSPAAVCISKIDELWNQVSGDAREFVEELYDSQKSQGRHLCDVNEINRRSDLTAKFIHQYWDQFNFRKELEPKLGDRVRYFPITSFGFTKPGDPPDPHFVIAPLLWLLHMTGYRVLPRSGKSNRQQRAGSLPSRTTG